MYDLMGGAIAYRDSLISDQDSVTNQHRNEIIIIFVLSIVSLLIGYIFFLFRTRRIIFDVEKRTLKMGLLDPNTDVNERIGMGSASYKTEYSCDCMRMDILNHTVLLYVAHLCASIDWTMNIEKETQDIIKMKEQNYSEEIDTILQLANIVKYERQQLQITNDDNKLLIATQTISEDEEHLKNIRRCVLNLLSIVFRFFCNCLSDQEKMINNYSIDIKHSHFHEAFHAVLVVKLQKLCFKIIKSARDSKKAIPPMFAQKLKNFFASWLNEHVIVVDKDLSTLLLGKAPDSELDRFVSISQRLITPKSYIEYISNEYVPSKIKQKFEKLKKILRLDENN
ncbi:MAG: hypothetical protein EZS28_032037 [Streblomastix strix]|uniref:Uncharacterized protein n=1 Tax=Streblomastix strix TaxID=222440 RepID=A0A5J4UNY1_9EUKA|nr:MAG: hypothetical protein EZS28_032037 [Streblomastix strix]